jgi:hypothetical protein
VSNDDRDKADEAVKVVEEALKPKPFDTENDYELKEELEKSIPERDKDKYRFCKIGGKCGMMAIEMVLYEVAEEMYELMAEYFTKFEIKPNTHNVKKVMKVLKDKIRPDTYIDFSKVKKGADNDT